MPISMYERFGDVSFPMDGADVENTNLFSVADPGRDNLLALFASAINAELAKSTTVVEAGSVWAVVTPSTILDGKMPVEDTVYDMPRRSILRETKLKFPLLAIYRTSATHDEFSLAQERMTQLWGLDYIMGPLSVSDFRRLGATLNAVKNIVQLVIRRRGHPSYKNGALQFGPGTGRFSTIGVVESSEGPAQFGQEGEGMEFHALNMILRTTELGILEQGIDPTFEGASVGIGIGSESAVLKDAINVRTEVPLDPNHGKPEP